MPFKPTCLPTSFVEVKTFAVVASFFNYQIEALNEYLAGDPKPGYCLVSVQWQEESGNFLLAWTRNRGQMEITK